MADPLERQLRAKHELRTDNCIDAQLASLGSSAALDPSSLVNWFMKSVTYPPRTFFYTREMFIFGYYRFKARPKAWHVGETTHGVTQWGYTSYDWAFITEDGRLVKNTPFEPLAAGEKCNEAQVFAAAKLPALDLPKKPSWEVYRRVSS